MAMVLPMPTRLNPLIKHAYQLSIGILLAIFAAILLVLVEVARVVVPELLARHNALRPQHLLLLLAAAATLLYMCIVRRPRAVYLVEYTCFRAAPSCRIPSAMFIEHTRLMHRRLNDDDAASVVSYMTGMLERSGLGEETCVPPPLSYIPPDQSLRAVREEAELVIFSAVDALFAKAAAPRACSPGDDVDLVVVCCSLCAPAPSFADMVVSRYGMRSDVRAVNLSGMGCGAGLIAVDLAASLLRATPRGGRALVISTEILSSNYYVGTDHSMVRPNCIFRLSAAAMLLSTSSAGARFRLRRAVRSCSSADDSAYRCVFQEEDDEGNLGTRADVRFPAVAGDKVKANLATFAPGVLLTSELVRVALFAVAGSVVLRRRAGGGTYRPDLFRKAFQHFCIHAPAMAVVDTVQRGLGLSEEDVEASRMTLHRFGYTSSSSVMYELAYTEAKRRMRKGDWVWMVSFGAGFECTSVAWECVEPAGEADGSWADCIHRYPVGFVGRPLGQGPNE